MVVSKTYRIFAHIFDNEIEEYEAVRKDYQREIADKMGRQQWMEYNEILFSAHSCAIEGNSFTVDDTRILREQGMAMVPVGRSLLECTEMADHFRAFDYLVSRLDGPFDESLLKEINRLVTEHTLSYRAQGSAHYLAFIRKTFGIIGGKYYFCRLGQQGRCSTCCPSSRLPTTSRSTSSSVDSQAIEAVLPRWRKKHRF